MASGRPTNVPTAKTDLHPGGVTRAGIQSHGWNTPVRAHGAVGVATGTVGGYERPAPKRQAAWTGPECPNPDCGSTKTPVRTSGKDVYERPLRARRCENCGTTFTTIEQVVLFEGGPQHDAPVPFALVDVEHRRRKRESKRRRFGWQAGGAMRRTREVIIYNQPRVNGRNAR
jgi:hypothetical protein